MKTNPHSISVSELSCIFDDVTNSYKYLFFKGLLEQIKRQDFQLREIDLNEVLIDMLTIAWYPCVFFKIFLGGRDQIVTVLEQITPPKGSTRNYLNVRRHIEKEIKNIELPDLLQYVPSRILTGFYLKELRGTPDGKRSKALYDISIKTFNSKKLLYKFINKTTVEMHEEWLEYFKTNIKIVEGWFSWNWNEYLVQLNPNVPNLSEKLSPPSQRSSLKSQSEYWNVAIQSKQLKCIYSDEILTTKNYELDHYLPWSFVAHDKLWNLVPVLKEANRLKSDFLPPKNTFNKFVEIQHAGLISTMNQIPNKRWLKLIESFIYDLHISEEALLNITIKDLSDLYSQTLNPLIDLASSMGFKEI